MSTKVRGLRVVKETVDAIGVHRRTDDKTAEVIWLPTDQLMLIVRNKDGTADITMPDWLAEDREL